MNILILSPFFPWPLSQGGKIRVFNIIKYLSRNNKITLTCLSEEKISDYGPLADFCEEVVCVDRKQNPVKDLLVFLFSSEPFNFVRFSSEAFRETLRQLIKRKSFDLVLIEISLMWQYSRIIKGIPAVLNAQNIESEIVRQIGEIQKNLIKRFLYVLEERKLRRREEEAWRECSLCFAVSERERNSIASHLPEPGKVVTVPNGVDLERFEYLPKAHPGRQILFLGGMDYIPSLDSAHFFLNEIFPIIRSKVADVRADIVGRELWKINGNASQESVEFHENVPDVLPYFRKADLLVVPLRAGAGTRIKVLEAMAAGLPVVTTSKGCEGIEVRDGEHLLVADGAGDFADAVQRIFNDANLRKALVQNARHLVETKYSWEKIVQEMGKQIRDRGLGTGD